MLQNNFAVYDNCNILLLQTADIIFDFSLRFVKLNIEAGDKQYNQIRE